MRTLRADIVALNEQEQAVFVVEVSLHQKDSMPVLKRLLDEMRQYHTEYALLADLKHMKFFRFQHNELSEPLLTLTTASALSTYDSEFENKTIYEPYMVTLLEAWLRDIAYNWRSRKPPYLKDLRAIGLAQQLKGGTTRAAETVI